jgi:hypothetical protein
VTRLVPSETIEGIVGARRHPTEHLGRAVSKEQTVYVLHSEQCRDSGTDLRECPFSLALDSGIDDGYWEGAEDRPVRLAITPGWPVRLVPVAWLPEESTDGEA